VFDGPIANLKHKIDLALKSTACGVAAMAAAVIAIGFFCAAAFLWLAQSYGAIVASLVLGGVFLVLSLIALLVVVLLRRKPPPPAAKAAWWTDPALLAAALDIGRVLGRRRVASAVVVSAFIIGVLLNRPPRKPEN
jgi:hypothetical protein